MVLGSGVLRVLPILPSGVRSENWVDDSGVWFAMAVYRPTPISTEGINLPAELSALVEQLAENNHDHWAKQRLEAEWMYGPLRDDARKTHPDLVPYGDLPEHEKDLDRTSVVETLKVILKLGYEIVPRSCDG